MAQEVVTLEDYEAGADILRQCLQGAGPIGQTWLTHAFEHLAVKTDLYFRDRPPIRDQKAFLSMLRTMVEGYKEGAQALEVAARRLSKHGDSFGARTTHEASVTMARAAEELLGD